MMADKIYPVYKFGDQWIIATPDGPHTHTQGSGDYTPVKLKLDDDGPLMVERGRLYFVGEREPTPCSD